MTTIKLSTIINAPIDRCFDLARSIDVHLMSTGKTKEKVVAGRKTGLVLQGETVTWEAVHFGIKQKLTSKITEMNPPYFFSDEMIKGAFKSMCHEHHFSVDGGKTTMADVFKYETPFGVFGKSFNAILLQRYMKKFLAKRNMVIKAIAEGCEWLNILK